MPLYEYRCKGCGHTFEVMQKFSDRTLRTCKLCRGRLEKLVSRTSFQLKGGGWYDQGYGSSKSGGKSTGSGGQSSKKPESAAKPSAAKGGGQKSGD
jgi:putative FmdB family regulatory protein